FSSELGSMMKRCFFKSFWLVPNQKVIGVAFSFMSGPVSQIYLSSLIPTDNDALNCSDNAPAIKLGIATKSSICRLPLSHCALPQRICTKSNGRYWLGNPPQ